MRFHHTIEATDNAEDPTWYVVIAGDDLEEYDDTAAQYGRDVLKNWIIDQETDAGEPPTTVDEYGNPYLRVVVRFSDEPDEHDNKVAVVGSDELDTPPAELDAVDAAHDLKMYAKYLDRQADDQLEDTLRTARKKGRGANELARRVGGAVSRPVALRMMQEKCGR